MVERLIACTGDSKILNYVTYNYEYPEDWELLMDPNEKWLKEEFIPKGYKIGCITYDYNIKTLLYICVKED